ncbi:MAG: hypothetical protein ACOCUQ_03340 [Bacteroidota bacterium]
MNISAERIIQKLNEKTCPSFLLSGYQHFRQTGISITPINTAHITLQRLQQMQQKKMNDNNIGKQIEFVIP